MKRIVSWIVVADGGHARIYANEGPGKGLHPVAGEERDAHLHHAARDIVTDRPGRTFDSAGGQRHDKEPPTDPRRQEKENFLAGLAGDLGEAAQAGRYDRLILVAEPRALGALRQHLPSAAEAKVHAELAKDLVKATVDDVAKHVADVLAV